MAVTSYKGGRRNRDGKAIQGDHNMASKILDKNDEMVHHVYTAAQASITGVFECDN